MPKKLSDWACHALRHEYGRCHGSAIEVIISKEVSVGGKFWINSGLAEEVQIDSGLIEKSVPLTHRKIGIGC